MTNTKFLQLLSALVLMGLLWTGLDGACALTSLGQADAGWLLAALLTLTLQTLLSAYRWQFTAGRLGQHFTLSHAIREYYLGQIVNQSLPGGMLGDAGRAMRARSIGGLRRSGAAVVIERASGQVALLVVLAAAFLMWSGPVLPHPVQALILLILAGAVSIAVIFGFSTLLQGRTGAAARNAVASAKSALVGGNALPQQIALNLTITAANIAAFAFCARATGTQIMAGQAALLVPLILLTMILPLTISGWGLREGAAAALFPLIGASASAGLAASTAFGLLFLASTLPGLLVLMTQNRVPTHNSIQVDP